MSYFVYNFCLSMWNGLQNTNIYHCIVMYWWIQCFFCIIWELYYECDILCHSSDFYFFTVAWIDTDKNCKRQYNPIYGKYVYNITLLSESDMTNKALFLRIIFLLPSLFKSLTNLKMENMFNSSWEELLKFKILLFQLLY